MSSKSNDADNLFCSFCGKSQSEISKLIAGPGVYICDECVRLCNDILNKELVTAEREKAPLLTPKEIHNLSITQTLSRTIVTSLTTFVTFGRRATIWAKRSLIA